MSKTVAGFFGTLTEGEAARKKLLESGFTADEISFVAGDTAGHELPVLGPLTSTGAESELAQDVTLGGAIGVALGAIAVVLPGFGALLAAGPLAVAMGGLTAGVGIGGIVGLLRDHGISEDEAHFYSDGVKRGGALVTVHGVSEAREAEARRLMMESHALQTEELQPDEAAGEEDGLSSAAEAG